MVTPDGPNRDLRVEGFENEPPVVGSSLLDALIALWLCIITPVRAWYSREEAGDPPEMDMLIAYGKRRMGLDDSDLDAFTIACRKVNKRRNALFKGGGGMTVSRDGVDEVARRANQILLAELRQLKSGT